jgi:6,7-dimethyl-8-ribityllumazine synthase
MVVQHRGSLDGSGLRIAIVVSRFNEFVTSRLLTGALDALEQHGVEAEKTEVYWVPGAFEIPLTAKKLASSRRFDAVVCLGTVIRGQTAHFEYVASEASRGIASVALETGIPISFGVLTTDNLEQAIERAGGKLGNKGREAAETALEMANLLRRLGD